MYINSGNDCETPSQMKTAIEYCSGIKGVKVCVANLNRKNQPDSKKIKDITKFNNVELNYDQQTLICHKAFEIGRGVEHKFDIEESSFALNITEQFEENDVVPNEVSSKKSKSSRNFLCSQPGCTQMFDTIVEKHLHEAKNIHEIHDEDVLENPKDKLKIKFINLILGTQTELILIINFLFLHIAYRIKYTFASIQVLYGL